MSFFFDGVPSASRRSARSTYRVGQQVLNMTFDLTDCTSIDIYFHSTRWAGTTNFNSIIILYCCGFANVALKS